MERAVSGNGTPRAARIEVVRAKMHSLLDELFDALTDDGGEPEPPKANDTRRRSRARPVPPPLKEPTDVDRMRAKQTLRRRGIYT